MNNRPVSQNRQPLCIDCGADLRDLDVEDIPKVNEHHYGLASTPIVPFILEKPTNLEIVILIFNQEGKGGLQILLCGLCP